MRPALPRRITKETIGTVNGVERGDEMLAKNSAMMSFARIDFNLHFFATLGARTIFVLHSFVILRVSFVPLRVHAVRLKFSQETRQ